MHPKLSAPLITAALLLTACPGTTAPSAPQPITSVSGTIVEDASTESTFATKPWSGGAGRVDGILDVAPLTSHESAVISTGTLAADGKFTLTLPASVPTSALIPVNSDNVNLTGLFDSLTGGATTCTGTPTFSTQNASQTSLGLTAVGSVQGDARPQQTTVTSSTSTTSTGTTTRIDTVARQGAVTYFDAPVTLKGTINCSGPVAQAPSGTVQGGITFNLNFAKGWNPLTVEISEKRVYTESGSSVSADVTLNIKLVSGSLPTTEWVVLAPLPTGQALKAPQKLFMR